MSLRNKISNLREQEDYGYTGRPSRHKPLLHVFSVSGKAKRLQVGPEQRLSLIAFLRTDRIIIRPRIILNIHLPGSQVLSPTSSLL